MKKYIDMTIKELNEQVHWCRIGVLFFLTVTIVVAALNLFYVTPLVYVVLFAMFTVSFVVFNAAGALLLYMKRVLAENRRRSKAKLKRRSRK